MKTWYRIFIDALWYYLRYKLIFFFLLKMYIIFKLFSITLDIYYGHLPKVFQNMTFKFYNKEVISYIDINIIKYFNSHLSILFIFILLNLLFIYFFRLLNPLKHIEEKMIKMRELMFLEEFEMSKDKQNKKKISLKYRWDIQKKETLKWKKSVKQGTAERIALKKRRVELDQKWKDLEEKKNKQNENNNLI